jgi:hypothetical protein
MKERSNRFASCLCAGLLLIVCLGLSGPALAQWVFTPGCSGQLHDPSLHDTGVEPVLYRAWGMGYAQVPFATNWIIFPITIQGPVATRYLAINLETVLGGDLVVDRVAVWAGETRLVNDIVVDWSGEDLGFQVLDLGTWLPVHTLSISIRTWTGEFGGELNVYSVGAYAAPVSP